MPACFPRGLAPTLVLAVVFWAYAGQANGETRYLSIVLKPRNYVSPREMDNFTCGLDKAVEPSKLLAELNSVYLLEYLNNTDDPSLSYQTKVFDVAFFSLRDTLVRHGKQCGQKCSGLGYGLQSLILIPPSGQCYSGLFMDATKDGANYFVVYVGTTITEDIVSKYEAEAPKLKHLFDDKIPKLCGTSSFMRSQVTESRLETLISLFSFHFNETRLFSDPTLECRNKSDTEQSLAYSGLFDYSYSSVTFSTKNETAIESRRVFKTQMNRTSSGKIGVAFIETQMGTCDKSDLVPFNGPITFQAGEGSSSLFVQLKSDNITENGENFKLLLKNVPTRVKRTAQNAPQNQEQLVDMSDMEVKAKRTKVDTAVKVFTLPVGQGDSTLIQCPNGHITMIDMGATKYAYERTAFIEQINSFAMKQIRHIFFTHPDKDHISHGYQKGSAKGQPTGILVELFKKLPHEQVQIHIGNKQDWIGQNGNEMTRNLIEYVEPKGTALTDEQKKRRDLFQVVEHVDFPAVWQICGSQEITMTVIDGNLGSDRNSKSLVMKLQNKLQGATMLFLGDFEGQLAFDELMKKSTQLEASVIMIPHHGSYGGITNNVMENFYKAVQARYAVISSHVADTFKHPKQDIIAAFCHVLELNSCDAYCDEECDDGFTVWAPLATIRDDEKELLGLDSFGDSFGEPKPGGTFQFVLEQDAETCPSWNPHGPGSMMQTTGFKFQLPPGGSVDIVFKTLTTMLYNDGTVTQTSWTVKNGDNLFPPPT